ncbi:MAG: AMP-binding protein, partial [Pseudomonadota bacterium]|nr:AMP-binding protein [Pseudomonadota bacterium]
PDTPDLVTAFLAVQAIGAVVVPTFSQLRDEDLIYRVEDTGARVALVATELAPSFVPVADACQTLRNVLIAPNDPTGRFTSLGSHKHTDVAVPDYADTRADDLALIAYTSGTTGRPKGTSHCHADLLAAADTYSRHCIGTRPDDVLAGPPSLPFTMGAAFFIYYALRFGAASVLSADKSVEKYANLVRAHGVTVFVGVPTYYNRLLAHLRESGTKLPSLRMTLIGGEPLYPELEENWREAIGLPLEQFIGSTEMFHIYIGYRHGIDAPRVGVLGRAIPGYEITVRDPETFAEMPNGEHGLLCSRGPSATVYWSPREIQSDMVRDGWNIANDTVWRDDEGFIHFVARADEMIVTGGFNVAPADVENILMRHPAVLECACAPSPDETGERAAVVKAFVVAEANHETSPALASELQEFFKQNGPPFMYPRKVEFVDALPKGLTGKVQRSVLRQQEMGA